MSEILEAQWLSNFETLKAYVEETGHFPGKHTKLNNWCRYQRKRINSGNMPAHRRAMFEELAASRFSAGHDDHEQTLFSTEGEETA